MALPKVKSILLRIATDGSYRDQFLLQREKALESYISVLTAEEMQCLLELPNHEDALVEMVKDQVTTVASMSDIRL